MSYNIQSLWYTNGLFYEGLFISHFRFYAIKSMILHKKKEQSQQGLSEKNPYVFDIVLACNHIVVEV